ncbi:alpha-glucuronidase [Anaerosporobacter sp.]|uniref:alpha-glucuronidase n=1 Tax=Anaerosporobacter sp. TaxID=1872529 RepID=UPI0028A088F4|nr:alpha-glucuronidase [Anaerosporobacter sp.]
MQRNQSVRNIDYKIAPDIPYRMLNHWDNLDGSIERGYAGNSFFFQENEIIVNERTRMYARLLASVGINATVINNVNVKDCATGLISDMYYDKLRAMACIFKEYGIQLFLSLNFAAPMVLGGLHSADPLDEEVRTWWKEKMMEVYQNIPNLGGFLIKADSEGRPGPFTYGRTHADGANMLAEAVAPYEGLIIWRCFVYNCQQDWRDKVTDRARSGYDNFKPLDGKFLDNVILQIKNGPMDFQVREPITPLFGALHNTNQMLEVQIAQEYTGQQKHVCYLIPMFEQILQFHTYLQDQKDTIREIISGQALNQKNCGIAAVANTGNESNWTGHDLAAANLYGFGRLAYQKDCTAEDIAREWVEVTFGSNREMITTITDILMRSWPIYEQYTAPLGIGWMVNPNHHYGPNVDGYEYDRWGTYHRADHLGIGVDRSEMGTGYAMTYQEPLASTYNSVEACPDELLLFFHHVSYTHILKSGKSVIQHIYDTHFDGVENVENMMKALDKIKEYLPLAVYNRMVPRLEEQLRLAKEWRDQINTYFYRKSGIIDTKNRTIY